MVYVLIWIVVGALAGILGDKLSEDNTTVKNLCLYSLFGIFTFIGFLIFFLIYLNDMTSKPGVFELKFTSKFWNKVIIKNEKGET
jgi:biotin transporter BioY